MIYEDLHRRRGARTQQDRAFLPRRREAATVGGEAQRQESSLHARRMEVHAQLVTLLQPVAPDIDPLLARALILALEGAARIMLEESDEGRAVTQAGIERVRRVMMRMATAAVAGTGPGVAPLPPLK